MKTSNHLTLSTSPLSQPARKPCGTASLGHKRFLYRGSRRNPTGKERDSETGLYYYGARYLDSRTSRWLSGDPAMGDYVPSAPIDDEARKRNSNLPGQGGVFNYVNLHVYHYAGNNPVKYVDPNGETTEIDEATGKVMNVIDDGSKAMMTYQYSDDGTRSEGPGNYIGESFQSDSFEEGNIIHIGTDKTKDLYASVKSRWELNIITALKSRAGEKYDIKNTWGYNATDGVMFEGKYVSMQDLGNILAGINARVGDVPFDQFQRMAGALHVTGSMFAVGLAHQGGRFGTLPEHGETSRQYKASKYGYDISFNNYSNWRNSR